MIKPKEKKCKGTGKAAGHGCNEMALERKYGLCMPCYKDWLLNTNEGNQVLKKQTIQSTGKYVKQKKREWNVKKAKKNVELMSADKYRATYIQPLINEIARLIDYGQPCIATGNEQGKMSGGHRHSVGANRTLALNLHNIHIQSFHSNSCQGGDHLRYRLGLIQTYGVEYADFIDHKLNQCEPIKLTKEQLIELKPFLMTVRNDLKKNGIKRNAEHRIRLRNAINEQIGIYPREYSIYKLKNRT